jgi:hypothetical protein
MQGSTKPSARRLFSLSGNYQRAAELSRSRIPRCPGKRVQFDQETWNVPDLLAKDEIPDFQDLADEAFADLLNKHGRPVDLETGLRQSVGDTGKRPPATSDRRRDDLKKARRGG